MVCKDKIIDRKRDIYVCVFHKRIWKREPLYCRDCKYMMNYRREELKELLESGYHLMYSSFPNYHA